MERTAAFPAGTGTALIAAWVALVGMGILAICLHVAQTPGTVAKQIVDLFHLGREANLPTWFSSTLLIALAYLAFRIGGSRLPHACRFRGRWMALAAGLVLLSADEASVVHERLGGLVRMIMPTDGLFHHAWVLIAVIVVPMLAISSIAFIRALPALSRRHLLTAAAVYLAGAVGCEMASGALRDASASTATIYSWIALEESLEMAGLIIGFHALLRLQTISEQRQQLAPRAAAHATDGRERLSPAY